MLCGFLAGHWDPWRSVLIALPETWPRLLTIDTLPVARFPGLWTHFSELSAVFFPIINFALLSVVFPASRMLLIWCVAQQSDCLGTCGQHVRSQVDVLSKFSGVQLAVGSKLPAHRLLPAARSPSRLQASRCPDCCAFSCSGNYTFSEGQTNPRMSSFGE